MKKNIGKRRKKEKEQIEKKKEKSSARKKGTPLFFSLSLSPSPRIPLTFLLSLKLVKDYKSRCKVCMVSYCSVQAGLQMIDNVTSETVAIGTRASRPSHELEESRSLYNIQVLLLFEKLSRSQPVSKHSNFS